MKAKPHFSIGRIRGENEVKRPKIVNIVAMGCVHKIKFNKAAFKQLNGNYNEFFPSKIEMVVLTRKVCVFKSGTVLIFGAKSMQEVNAIFEQLLKRLKKVKKKVKT